MVTREVTAMYECLHHFYGPRSSPWLHALQASHPGTQLLPFRVHGHGDIFELGWHCDMMGVFSVVRWLLMRSVLLLLVDFWRMWRVWASLVVGSSGPFGFSA